MVEHSDATPVYLDYAAATPLADKVARAMQPYMSDVFYNPSALYGGARTAKAALEDARSLAARSIGARPSEIIFTAGGTESANLAIRGVMERFPDGELIISSIEHDAVRKPAHKYGALQCSVNAKGRVDPGSIRAQITESTVLISVMYANNEIGTVQPIKEIVDIARAVRSERAKAGNAMPLYVHTDACQAPLYLNVDVSRLGVDLMTLNGGKIYGPKQSGILYKKVGVELAPQIMGGGQEFGMRSGTESVAQAVGCAKALELAIAQRANVVRHTSELSAYFIAQLEERYNAVINGDRKHRLSNNIHATFQGADNERMLFSLDQQGVWAATGSACSASSEESSHVMHAIGKSDEDARSSIRFSIGRETTQAEIHRTLNAIDTALRA